ncbi:hypothetical protein PCLA_07f0279 [Pseudomonas citronellolis]|nr:hypothetical protein PCLA_07f0279 [Pseudomonas citronellolis]
MDARRAPALVPLRHEPRRGNLAGIKQRRRRRVRRIAAAGVIGR